MGGRSLGGLASPGSAGAAGLGPGQAFHGRSSPEVHHGWMREGAGGGGRGRRWSPSAVGGGGGGGRVRGNDCERDLGLAGPRRWRGVAWCQ